ncbi:hypothetical protein [Methylogaea oryzae]|uniref:hypothetical protein n=1 Tax=Methylogaea oryzae TaxID=1295382 RepID=UPI0006D23A89|nr:hypothetical protein [Methylogaea oryzae]
MRLAIQFQAELALGYQRVLESSQCATTFGPDQQATTAHRALSAYGLYLLRSAQSYLPPAAGLWGKIHQAYRCAESLGVAHRAVVDPDGPYASSASADECLRKIVLFQLALPTRLRQSEIAELYDWIDANIPLVRLQKERAFNLQEAQFFVDLAKDGNPQPIGALVTPHADIRYLFLEPSLLVQLRTGAACSTFGTDLAQRFAPLDDEGEEAQCRTALFATGAEGGAALLEAELAKVKQRLKTPERANLELHPGHAPRGRRCRPE